GPAERPCTFWIENGEREPALIAVVAHCPDVLECRAESTLEGKIHREQQIRRLLAIEVAGEADASAEETHIEADVSLARRFPAQLRVADDGTVVPRDDLAAEGVLLRQQVR